MIQPAGLGGRPVEGQCRTREGEGFLHGVLGGVDVPEHAGQDGDGSPVFLPEDAGDVRLRRRCPGGLRRRAGSGGGADAVSRTISGDA